MTRFLCSDRSGISQAVAHLRSGGVLAFPTETVYGLGADARNESAVREIYQIKQRPLYNPLIIHVADYKMAESFAEFDQQAREVIEHFWPGPLTLVLPLRKAHGLAPALLAGHDTVAVRAPDHPVANGLLRQFGGPIAAPSANPSGHLSTTIPQAIAAAFSDQDWPILQAGASKIGLESTILDMSGKGLRILRYGAISAADIAHILSQPVDEPPGLIVDQAGGTAAPKSPGLLAKHYAPRANLLLNCPLPKLRQGWLGFGPEPVDHFTNSEELCRNLSPSGDIYEAGHNFYRYLYELDQLPEVLEIAVAPIPDDIAMGKALNDRLRRAAVKS